MFNCLYRIKKQTYKDLVEATKNTIHFLGHEGITQQDMLYWNDYIWTLMRLVKKYLGAGYYYRFIRFYAESHFTDYKDEIRKTIGFLTEIVHDIRRQENFY